MALSYFLLLRSLIIKQPPETKVSQRIIIKKNKIKKGNSLTWAIQGRVRFWRLPNERIILERKPRLVKCA